MKCAHPNCNRGIGLVSYRRALTKARFCSKQCRDSYWTANIKPPARERIATTYFEWLFLPPAAEALPQMARAPGLIHRHLRAN